MPTSTSGSSLRVPTSKRSSPAPHPDRKLFSGDPHRSVLLVLTSEAKVLPCRPGLSIQGQVPGPPPCVWDPRFSVQAGVHLTDDSEGSRAGVCRLCPGRTSEGTPTPRKRVVFEEKTWADSYRR